MSLSKKESYSLILNFLYIIFFFLLIYLVITMFTRRKMSCGCCSNCYGDNISCPCYRRRAMMNSPSVFSTNEPFTPQIDSDFTSYLNEIRKNQLQFSKDNVKENYKTLNQKNIPTSLNNLRVQSAKTGKSPLEIFLGKK